MGQVLEGELPTLCESTHRGRDQRQEVPFETGTPVIATLGQVRLEDQEPKAMLGYMASSDQLGLHETLSRVPTMTYFLRPGPTYSRFQHFPEKHQQLKNRLSARAYGDIHTQLITSLG